MQVILSVLLFQVFHSASNGLAFYSPKSLGHMWPCDIYVMACVFFVYQARWMMDIELFSYTSLNIHKSRTRFDAVIGKLSGKNHTISLTILIWVSL